MCTAISYKTTHHYFGRNVDVERGYHEGVVITPRSYPLSFRYIESLEKHYALIGTAIIINDYPLYFEATNEKGLSMAGLNFPDNAFYYPHACEKENVAPFELIPYLLGCCKSVSEAKNRLSNINVVHCNFSEDYPVTPLHWMISDKDASITLECTKDGMTIYENPYGVLTNSPTFDFHLLNLKHSLLPLPGDFSSTSRFVKAVYVKEHSVCDGTEKESVNQFFHILQSVAMPKGCVVTQAGEYQYTHYSSCCNTDTQVYYYTTYQNMAVRKVDMHDVDLDSAALYSFPMES